MTEERKAFICKRHNVEKFRTPGRGSLECTQCNTECHRRRRERCREQNGIERHAGTRQRGRMETDVLCKKHRTKKRRGVDGSLKCNVCERLAVARLKRRKRKAAAEARQPPRLAKREERAKLLQLRQEKEHRANRREDDDRWNRGFAKFADPHYYDHCDFKKQWRREIGK